MKSPYYTLAFVILCALLQPGGCLDMALPVCAASTASSEGVEPWSMTLQDASTGQPVRVRTGEVRVTETDLTSVCRLWFGLTDDDEIAVLTNGSISLYNGSMTLNEPYCVQPPALPDARPTVFMCFPSEPLAPLSVVLVAGFIISIVFILLTCTVYAVLPRLRDLHGKTILCHACSLLFVYIFLILSYSGENNYSLTAAQCHAVSICLHYFLLAAFTWLTVLNFDIYHQVSGQPKILAKLGFLGYNIIGWGVGLIPVITAVVADRVDTIKVKPHYGINHCWINERDSRLAYVYLPLTFLLSCNVVFFFLTIKTIRKTSQSQDSSSNVSKGKRLKEAWRQCATCLKLFLVMGLCWIMEVVAWACQHYLETPAIYFAVTDFINSIQGLLIFVVVVCNKAVLKRIKRKFKIRKPDASKLENSETSLSNSNVKVHPVVFKMEDK